ncbi:MAG: response regulator, partial [Deltaproteobacteria bacterium]|nr:response regulator [Deltaproteobacteria bacterium]
MKVRTKILVIEDEVPIRRFLRASLADDDFELHEAETGTEGIRLAASHNPDIILLDLGLPDIDGIEVTKRLREWSAKPIIVLSARGNEEDKIAALDNGANDYLTKPFGVGELLARIRVALRWTKMVSE